MAKTADITRVGVVGVGYFGAHHARHYAAHPAARLTAVVDADPARVGEVARRHGVEGFADYRALIGKVDAVSIATTTSAHHRVASDLIDAGIHVLIEKPITPDAASAADLIARAERAGVILQVGHIERFSPAFVALAERAPSPRRIAAVRRTVWTGRAADVDVVLDLMIHDIDLVLTLAGAPVASVTAEGAAVRSDALDEVEAWFTFANGVVATLSASRVAEAAVRKITVTEPHRVLVADLAVPSLTVSRRTTNARASGIPIPVRDKLADQIGGFLESIATGKRPLVDGRAGLAALEVAERVEAAIAAGTKGSAVRQEVLAR